MSPRSLTLAAALAYVLAGCSTGPGDFSALPEPTPAPAAAPELEIPVVLVPYRHIANRATLCEFPCAKRPCR